MFATADILKEKNSSNNPIVVILEKDCLVVSDLKNTFSKSIKVPPLAEYEDCWGAIKILFNGKEYETDYNLFVTKEYITLILYPLEEVAQRHFGGILFYKTEINSMPTRVVEGKMYLTDTSYPVKFQFENPENANNAKLVKDFIKGTYNKIQ